MPVTEAQVRALRVNDTVTIEGPLFGIRDANQIALFDKGRVTRFDMRGHAAIHTAPNVRKVAQTPSIPTGYAPICVGTTTRRAWSASRGRSWSSSACASSSARGAGRRLAAGISRAGGRLPRHHRGTAALETTWVEAIEDVDLDDLNPESLWKFRVKGFGPLLVAMDSQGAASTTKWTEGPLPGARTHWRNLVSNSGSTRWRMVWRLFFWRKIG
jgi:L(+)-tartrate dehydratase beta subunit